VRIFRIDAPLEGRLAIMPRPLGGERLTDEIVELKTAGVTAVLSLLEPSEAQELELLHERDLCAANSIAFLSFPIPDRGLPQDETAFAALCKRLAEAVLAGGSVAIHCRAGIGRSSLAAAKILAHAGVGGTQALALISHARHLTVPDTDEQRRWIIALEIGR
jgi:protein-tyrosine phosphatase